MCGRRIPGLSESRRVEVHPPICDRQTMRRRTPDEDHLPREYVDQRWQVEIVARLRHLRRGRTGGEGPRALKGYALPRPRNRRRWRKDTCRGRNCAAERPSGSRGTQVLRSPRKSDARLPLETATARHVAIALRFNAMRLPFIAFNGYTQANWPAQYTADQLLAVQIATDRFVARGILPGDK